MKDQTLELLQGCTSFGVKKFEVRHSMAEREGFEPLVVLLLHTLYKRDYYKRVMRLQEIFTIKY